LGGEANDIDLLANEEIGAPAAYGPWGQRDGGRKLNPSDAGFLQREKKDADMICATEVPNITTTALGGTREKKKNGIVSKKRWSNEKS